MNRDTKKDFLTLKDQSRSLILEMINTAAAIKSHPDRYREILKGKNIALMFNKHSTRTRLSFEAGISQMGGNAMYLDTGSLQVSRGEDYSDTAKVFSRYLDGVIIRTFQQEIVDTFARDASIPVINGLTDRYHPCQILSDLFTIDEMGMLEEGLRLTYFGDSNNVTNSLMIGLSKLGLGITICSPPEYGPDEEIVDYCRSIAGSDVRLETDPARGAHRADIIYTDVWVSMGDEHSGDKIDRLKPYQVNMDILGHAADGVKVMHCLPAHRGQEITSEVMDSPGSRVFEQAENRLHAQKALLHHIYGNNKRSTG